MRTAIFLLVALALLNDIDAVFQCIKKHKKGQNSSGDKHDGTTPCSSDGSSGNGKSGKGSSNSKESSTAIPTLRPILDVKPLATLEGICFDACNNCSGLGTVSNVQDAVSGLLGSVVGGGKDGNTGGLFGGILSNSPVKCLSDAGNKLTGQQACAFTCILNLNVLNTCDIQAIISKLLAICPNLDYHAICASACLCCDDSSKPLNLCVDVCLTHANGSTKGVQIPLVGSPPLANLVPQDILPGLPGVFLNVSSDRSGEGSSAGSIASGSSSGSGSGSGSSSGSQSGSGSGSGSSGQGGSSGQSGSGSSANANANAAANASSNSNGNGNSSANAAASGQASANSTSN